MKTISKLAALPLAAVVAVQTSAPAFAEDLLGNQTAAAYTDISDTQQGQAPLIIGIVGFTVVLGLAIRWLKKAG